MGFLYLAVLPSAVSSSIASGPSELAPRMPSFAIWRYAVASALASQQAHAAAARDLSKQFDVPDPKAVYGLQRFLDSIESVR